MFSALAALVGGFGKWSVGLRYILQLIPLEYYSVIGRHCDGVSLDDYACSLCCPNI